MKFLDKLKKLKRRNKNNLVDISVLHDNFNQIKNIDLYEVVKSDEVVNFKVKYTDYLKIRKDKLYQIRNNKLKTLIMSSKNKLIISFIMIFFIFIIFLLNQFLVRQIEFKDKIYYNEQVYNYVINKTNKTGKYYFLKDNINSISEELRKKFYQYAYIGLLKKGSKILIEIEVESIKSENINDDNLIGEYISTNDGIIQSIKIQSGNVLVKCNDVVKKNQVLVTSNLFYDDNLFNKEKIVPLKGYIIAKIKTYKNIKVLKEEYVKVITNVDKNKIIFTFKDEIKFENKNKFCKVYNVFKIGNFSLKNMTIYNLQEVKVERNFDDALDYAKYLVYMEYLNEFEYEEEKVISIDNVKIEEFEHEFNYLFLVTTVQNVVQYNKNL